MSKTIDIIKEKKIVSQEIKDKIKSFNKIKKDILHCLENEQKTIPQIAAEINMPSEIVTFYLMTLMRYGYVVAGDIDDNEEYYFYNLKK